eukprot:Opistho-2@7388
MKGLDLKDAAAFQLDLRPTSQQERFDYNGGQFGAASVWGGAPPHRPPSHADSPWGNSKATPSSPSARTMGLPPPPTGSTVLSLDEIERKMREGGQQGGAAALQQQQQHAPPGFPPGVNFPPYGYPNYGPP